MKSFTIKNEKNDLVNVDLIRYFKFKNDKFLVYTKNELGDNNLLILYLVRIMEELGEPVVQTIKNEKDWSTMQGIIKKAIKEIKSGHFKLLEDLNYEEIANIKVVEPRFFKLEPKLVEILASEYLGSENNINFDNSLGELETIDETLLKEELNVESESLEPITNETDLIENNAEVSTFESQTEIESNDSIEDSNTSVSDISVEPVEIEENVEVTSKTSELVEEPKEEVIEINIEPIGIEENIEVQEEPEVVIETSELIEDQNENNLNINVEPNVGVTSDNSNDDIIFDANEDDIDYKALYIAMKEENESSSQLLEDLMERLMKYQMKYGELDD